MDTNKFVRLNIVLKPPEAVTNKAIALSREVGKDNEVFFVLDGVQFYPHITVYSPKYPESNIDKVLNAVEEIANNTTSFKFWFQKVSSEQGSIVIEFNYSPAIKSFHEITVQKLNPLREGHIRKKYQEGSDYHMSFSLEQKENIKKYGYPDSMSLYSPHLTITRLKEESLAGAVLKSINWDITQFTVDKIAVYKMGEHGTCKELVKEFNLKRA